MENELLTKLFSAYTEDFYIRHEEPGTFLANEKSIKDTEKDGKFPTTKFLDLLETRSHAYTLGDMAFIMGLLKPSGKTLQRSALLQDLRDFASRHFNERIIDRSYLEQIERINKDFRRKAAHPNVLDQSVAKRCREQVRACLNELILNYRGATADLLNGKRS